ncbi:hypothetical protein Tagg_0887 [Thermosphaera aggregans DSM 11486]|uniref:Uncharacterized protein n=1 Tax=Thermosphaera aggregans (strain DSM 11486 / M11TL) TaxID=633148 RepID=D5U209_THEAM|nr:hypothetical protein Tagg_0887 [Thermosphaera aggregans DSM 11486]
MEEVSAWILFYFILGLLPFLDPWLVREMREWLGLLDAFASFVFILRILGLIINTQASNVAPHICLYVQGALVGAGEYMFYLIGANISRCVRFGRFSWRRFLSYIVIGPLLILVGLAIQC